MRVRRLLQLTSAVLFIDTVMLAAITPLLPRYVELLGLGKAGAGVLVASYPTGTFLGAIPAILFARRFGVKLTVFTGMALLAVSTAAFSVAESAPALILSRFVQGLSGSLSWGGALGWLVGAAPQETRGQTIGFALAAALAGAMLGPVLGGAAAALSAQTVFLAVAAVSGALAALTLTIRTPQRRTRPEVRQIRTALRDLRVRAGLWIMTWLGLSFAAIETLAPLQIKAAGMGETGIAIAFTGTVAIETLLAPVMGRFSDRRGRLAPLRVCLPLAVIVLLAFGWAASAALLMGLVVASGIAIGPLWTPGTALFSDGADAAGVDHVVSFSMSNVAWAFGGLAGGYSAGGLAELSSEWVPYTLIAAVTAATIVWVRARGGRLEKASFSTAPAR
jgi:MFS family permease